MTEGSPSSDSTEARRPSLISICSLSIKSLSELGVALLEGVYAAFGIYHGLLTGKVRVASRASVNRHGFLRGTSVYDVTARARDRRVSICRMYVAFHFVFFLVAQIECDIISNFPYA